MTARKPRIEYYWRAVRVEHLTQEATFDQVIDWRLVGANGEIMCFCNQGFRDKADANRAVGAVVAVFSRFFGDESTLRIVGPGKKPNA